LVEPDALKDIGQIRGPMTIGPVVTVWVESVVADPEEELLPVPDATIGPPPTQTGAPESSSSAVAIGTPELSAAVTASASTSRSAVTLSFGSRLAVVPRLQLVPSGDMIRIVAALRSSVTVCWLPLSS
jgi:hypothetical protein